MDQQQSEDENRQTHKLLKELCLIAVLIPAAVAALIWIYLSIKNQQLLHKQWKTIVMIIWLATLASLSWASLASLSGARPFRRAWKLKARALEEDGLRSQVHMTQKWERKKTNRLLFELVGMGTIVPFLSTAVTWAYFFFEGKYLTRANWKLIAFAVWIGTLLALIRTGKKALSDKLVFDNKDRGELN